MLQFALTKLDTKAKMSEIKDRTKIFMDPEYVRIDLQKCDKVHQPSYHVLFLVYLLLGYNWYTTDDLNNVAVISTGM